MAGILLKKIRSEDFHNENKLEYLIDKTAEYLYPKILHADEELVIKKYNQIPEHILKQVFQRVEENTREEKRPVIYIEIDSRLLSLRFENEIEFYKTILGRVIEGFENSRYGTLDTLKMIKEDYENDFTLIYGREYKLFSKEKESLLAKNKNFGANLAYFFREIKDDRFYRPIPLINISAVPNFPEKSAKVQPEYPDNLITEEAVEFERNAANSSYLMQNIWFGGAGLFKTVSVPGWTIDVLSGAWHKTQYWKKFGTGEGFIREELIYRKFIKL